MIDIYRRAHFVTSAQQPKQFPTDEGIEVAFAGRSNAGKSSALNTLCENKSLARTSKTPGRTQLINFFTLGLKRHLVDLPGYGYAKVPEKVRKDWQKLMESYLGARHSLKGLVIVMDIRHPLTDYDLQMLEWCRHYGTPTHILLTKADKLKRGPAQSTLHSVRQQLKQQELDVTVQIFSALKRQGVETLKLVLDDWFELSRLKSQVGGE